MCEREKGIGERKEGKSGEGKEEGNIERRGEGKEKKRPLMNMMREERERGIGIICVGMVKCEMYAQTTKYYFQ